MATDSATTSDRSEIVCPLSLKIAIASEGRLGAIQSYRCQPKSGGKWETRPQKSDKWASDFFKVLNAKKDEVVTLSDGQTKMNGVDQPSDTRFLFSDQDGVTARKYAIKFVKEGRLRAPKSWDRSFSSEAEITLEQLKATYPTMYETAATRTRSTEPDEEVEVLGAGFFDETVTLNNEGESAIEVDPLSEEDEQLIAEEEAEFAVAGIDDDEPYSVVAEMGLDEMAADEELPRHRHPESPSATQALRITAPPVGGTLHANVLAFRADMGGKYVTFYKIRNPRTGNNVWVQEGDQECVHDLHLTVSKSNVHH